MLEDSKLFAAQLLGCCSKDLREIFGAGGVASQGLWYGVIGFEGEDFVVGVALKGEKGRRCSLCPGESGGGCASERCVGGVGGSGGEGSGGLIS